MRILTGLTALSLAAACFTGCQNGWKSDDVSYDSISDDLTPELRTTTERPIDVDSHIAVTNNHNVRMMWDDLGRVFYTDHPSRLSPYPITYTSGKPR